MHSERRWYWPWNKPSRAATGNATPAPARRGRTAVGELLALDLELLTHPSAGPEGDPPAGDDRGGGGLLGHRQQWAHRRDVHVRREVQALGLLTIAPIITQASGHEASSAQIKGGRRGVVSTGLRLQLLRIHQVVADHQLRGSRARRAGVPGSNSSSVSMNADAHQNFMTVPSSIRSSWPSPRADRPCRWRWPAWLRGSPIGATPSRRRTTADGGGARTFQRCRGVRRCRGTRSPG